ncbi:cystic fibrosis transmembrane conductance regulator-like [Diaphorina citri]|uniref:Cystic fibrosis transmembrane conductance regulator-like n=1 Tax=Diaphorina citri TaxID=121845 RepID=A0A3Q0JE66_DIACI|nr:cystic fibrosis transmembrane conductance regulator-like [Diaphorina citri]
MDAGKRKYDKPPNPRATCNILSALTFSWTLGLFREGRKRDLEVTDLYEPLREHTSSYLGNKLERIWNEELITAKKRGREPSFLRSLAKCFGPKMILYGLVLAFMECVLRMSQPFLLGRVIEYFSPPEDSSPSAAGAILAADVNRSVTPGGGPLSLNRSRSFGTDEVSTIGGPPSTATSLAEALLFALGVIGTILVSNIIMHNFMMAMFHLGMKMRVGTCSMIYRKVCSPLFMNGMTNKASSDKEDVTVDEGKEWK